MDQKIVTGITPDTTPPVVVIKGVPEHSNGPFTATIEFNENVIGFSEGDITVVGANLSAFTKLADDKYTVVVTPTAAAVTLNVAADVATDAAGNKNGAAAQAASAYDIVKPTVTISGVPANSNAVFTATITFNENVTGFSVDDITVVGADLSTFTKLADDEYTVAVTPTAAAVTLNVAADVAMDASGNGNAAADEAASAFDNANPTVTISGVPANSNAVFTATITFNENVTGFSVDDITVVGADLSTFTKLADDEYTVAVTPTAAAVTLNVAADVAMDASGNGNAAADEAASAFDNANPTVTISGVPANSNAVFTATITFNENVTGFSVDDITVVGADLSTFTKLADDEYTVAVTPTAAAVTLNVAADVAMDASGNGNAAADEAASAFDNANPTVTISGVPANSNAVFTATITFNENVTGFSVDDITVVGADLSTFTKLADDEYTVAVTPTAAAVTLNVAADVAMDASGNGNAAADEAASAFDNANPTVTISGVPANSNAVFTATITFNENVTGFSVDDITVVGADLSTFTKLADDEYTVAVTPTAAAVTLNVAADVAMDASGNGNAAADEAASAFDNANPTVTISGVPANSNAVFTATITFNENVTGFSVDDITVVGADLSTFTKLADDEYTVAVTPTAAAVTLNVAADVAMDASGNGNAAADEAASAFDNVKPTVTISGVPGNSKDLFTATITFSEDVTGFSESDITVVGATLSGFTKVDDDKYTVAVTPTDGIVTLNVAADVAMDASGNKNTAADEARSALLMFSNSFNTSAETGTVFDVDLIFSDDATFFWTHLTAPKGGVIGNRRTITPKRKYRFRYTVTATGEGSEYQAKVDGARWNSSGDLVDQKIVTGITPDTTPPVVVIKGVPEHSNGPFTATIEFNENVIGFSEGDITVVGANLSAFTKLADDKYTVVVTPTAAAVTLNVAADVATDAAGNKNGAAAQAASAYDIVKPTVTISGVPANSNAVFTATITFNENVTGFSVDDITVVGADLSTFTKLADDEYTVCSDTHSCGRDLKCRSRCSNGCVG